jgi:hypothetical protein
MRDAVAALLANKKIEANDIADRIDANLKALAEHPDYAFLFNDRAQIVLKAADDLAMLITSRIDAHKKSEADRVAKIEADAKVKAEAEARAKLEAEAKAKADAQAKAEADARIAAEALIAKQSTVAPAALQTHVNNAPAVASTVLSEKPRVTATAQGIRPTDAQIITLIAGTYRVPEIKALGWLAAIDFDAATKRTECAA